MIEEKEGKREKKGKGWEVNFFFYYAYKALVVLIIFFCCGDNNSGKRGAVPCIHLLTHSQKRIQKRNLSETHKIK